MTEQAAIMALLLKLVTQGEQLRRELSELARQCDTLEVLIHGVNARFDE